MTAEFWDTSLWLQAAKPQNEHNPEKGSGRFQQAGAFGSSNECLYLLQKFTCGPVGGSWESQQLTGQKLCTQRLSPLCLSNRKVMGEILKY